MKRGMYAPLYYSYLNLAASRCYKLYNVLSKDEKEDLWNLLHSGQLEALGISGRGPEDFEKEDVYAFIANAQMYTHEQYKKRLDRGAEQTAKIETSMKNFKAKKKLKSFFSGLFVRKKPKE